MWRKVWFFCIRVQSNIYQWFTFLTDCKRELGCSRVLGVLEGPVGSWRVLGFLDKEKRWGWKGGGSSLVKTPSSVTWANGSLTASGHRVNGQLIKASPPNSRERWGRGRGERGGVREGRVGWEEGWGIMPRWQQLQISSISSNSKTQLAHRPNEQSRSRKYSVMGGCSWGGVWRCHLVYGLTHMWRLWRTNMLMWRKHSKDRNRWTMGITTTTAGRLWFLWLRMRWLRTTRCPIPDMGWDITQDQDTIMLRHLHTQIPLQRDIFTQGHHHTRKHGTPWHWDTFIHTGTPLHRKPHTGTHTRGQPHTEKL